MAYGPLCQCAFMAGPPQFQKKDTIKKYDKVIHDKLPPFQPPTAAEVPAPGAFLMYALDIEEAKADPTNASRNMTLDEVKALTFGSSLEIEGQVYDGHKTVTEQHACLYHARGKWFVKAINGVVHVESMTLHPYLRDQDGKPPKKYTSAGVKKIMSFSPMDPKRKLTREFCVFRFGDSQRRFWVQGPLPLGDGEAEETTGEPHEGRKKKEKAPRGRDEGGRHDRSRTRSRSRKRRR
mmetsp:Transcript_27001/g.62340  ORF Transcript_27001/g.62340 Transcript_27001/m.62340 type:complete len:236 (+) Transcript_27001:114-821(+)